MISCSSTCSGSSGLAWWRPTGMALVPTMATLRVMGFTRAEVSWTLLGQLLVQMLIALPIGFLLGHALAAFILDLISSEEFRIPLVVDGGTYALAGSVMLAAGLASALIVRRRIDQLDLIGVLKTRD